MKKLMLACLILGSSIINGQVENNEDYIILKGDKETIFLNQNGQDYDPHFSISKDDNKTNKKIYDVKLDIPSKEKKSWCIYQ